MPWRNNGDSMAPPPDFTYNGNVVSWHGRLSFYVTSNSEKDWTHLVDLEGFEKWATVCNCHAWRYGNRPCRHIKASLYTLAFWAGVKEEIRDEWCENLSFLLSMGFSFDRAMQAPMMEELKVKPRQSVRHYHLPPREEKTIKQSFENIRTQKLHEATVSNS